MRSSCSTVVQPARLLACACVGLLSLSVDLSSVLAQETEKAPEQTRQSPREKDPEKQAPADGSVTPRRAPLPNGVLARVNGVDVTVDEYSEYLLTVFGKTKLADLLDRVVVEQDARRLGIAVGAEEVTRAVDQQIDQTVRVLYKGDRAKFESVYLGRLGMTLGEYRAFLAQKKAYDVLLERSIVKQRQVSDSDVKKEFERTYGEDGVRYDLRHLLVRTDRPAAGQKDPLGDAEARKQAEEILEKIREGAEFVEMVRLHSHDQLTKRNDGRIPTYRKYSYGDAFHRALLELSEEKPVSGVVKSRKGYHLIYFLAKTTTDPEAKRAEIVDFLKRKPPTQAEKHGYVKNLREKAKIEK